MEIKVLPVFLCALILLWTAQELHGYTSPFVHGKGGQSGKKKKSEIWQKVSLYRNHIFFVFVCCLYIAAERSFDGVKQRRKNWMLCQANRELEIRTCSG